MKKVFTILTAAGLALLCESCGNTTSNAYDVDKNENNTSSAVEYALQHRHSVRNFDTNKTVSEEQMLKILWAGFGLTREDGKRTAPSCINAQDIHLYVCQNDGTFEYLAKENALRKVTDTDIRPIIAGHNEFIKEVQTILVVSDQTPFERFGATKADLYSGIDAGVVSENISLYCTAVGMGTVCCSPGMNYEAIREALALSSAMKPILYHPVGWEASYPH